MFGNLGMGELLLIGLIVLLVFGARRIPEIAGSFGKGIKEFKKNLNEVNNEIRSPDQPASIGAGSAPVAQPVAQQEEVARPEPKRLMN